jgi:putative SOS response-associated peptidase YedK
MCGRFTLTQSPNAVAQAFGIEVPKFPPRYNIAPSQPVGVVVQSSGQPRRQFRLMQWGLIPSWAKEPSIGSKLINARSETVHEKPSFRSAFKHRRCLIAADGFYEWQKKGSGAKQPFYFSMKDNSIFAFAGLWESWQDIETCTILTTSANELLKPIHERMPVIVKPKDYDVWLDPIVERTDVLAPIFEPFAFNQMVATAVSTAVNKPSVDSDICIQPLNSA